MYSHKMCCAFAPSFLAIKSTVAEENRGKETWPLFPLPRETWERDWLMYANVYHDGTVRWTSLACCTRGIVSASPRQLVSSYLPVTSDLFFQHMPGWPTHPCLKCCCFMCSIVWLRQNPPFCLRVVTPRLSAAWISDRPFRHFAPRSTHRDLK